MFTLYANKNQLTVRRREPVTSGSVNIYPVQFEFSEDWDGLARTAVFRAGTESRSLLLEESGACTVPWEPLTKAGVHLFAGVCGTRDGRTVLPTIWADLGVILEGASLGTEAQPPTPELWEQELARKGDKLDYTPDGELGLFAGDELLSAVPVAAGGEGGVSDHRLLAHRDAGAQHPIGAITGLLEELERIPEPVEALSNMELEEMLK